MKGHKHDVMRPRRNAIALLLAATTAITPIVVDASCSICPDGVSLTEVALSLGIDGDEITDEPELQLMCESVVEEAASLYEEDSNDCLLSKTQMIPRCCPTEPDVTCTFCPDGITVTSETDIALCESLVKGAAVFEEGSDLCDFADAGNFCCKSTSIDDFAPTNPCSICPDGVSLTEVALLLGIDGDEITNESELQQMCESTLEWANIYEEDSGDCLLSKTQIVPRCCPSEPDVTCTFCPDGITIDGEDNVAQCESHTKEAAVFEEGSDLCETAKASEAFCCGSLFDDLDPAAPPTEGAEVAMPGDGESTQDFGNVAVDETGNMTTVSPVAVPDSMTSSPVASPVDETDVPVEITTSSPIASTTGETSAPSSKPTASPTKASDTGSTPDGGADPIEGQPNSAAFEMFASNMSRILFLVTGFLFAWKL